MFIVKRNGKREKFDPEKIKRALEKANLSVSEEHRISQTIINNIANKVEQLANEKETMFTIEDIQNAIEDYLITANKFELTRACIKYRYIKAMAKNKYAELMDAVAKKVACKDVVNQNANLDEKSFGGRLGETTSLIMKQYALDYCVSPTTRDNHINNMIYIHDQDHYAVGDHNCLTVPFDQLLSEGFNTRQTDVRASGSINTALQLVAVIFQLQSLVQFGGVSAATLDSTLVPYIRKSFSKYFVDEMKDRKPKWKKEVPKELSFNDPEFNRRKYRKIYNAAMRLLVKETHQAVEAMYHNLNTLQSRSGNQLPFSSINFGLCTEPEGRLLSKEFLEVCREGLGKYHRTSIFPCVIFQCKKGVNVDPKDPNYDLFKLALQCTSERLYPNYGNCDWSVQKKWVAEDREIKNRVINELSKEDKKKLIERVKNNKDLQYVLALDENAVPLKEEQRYEVFSTMGALAGHEHLYIKIDDGQPLDISIKDLFDYCNNGVLKGSRPCQLYLSKGKEYKESPNLLTLGRDQSKFNMYPSKPGVYSITYIPEDVTYIGSSSDINRRFREHRCCINKYGCLDSGPGFKDYDLSNYRFEILQLTEDYKEKEKEYILSTPNVNCKGVNEGYYKRISNRAPTVFERPKYTPNLNYPQKLIDLKSKNIKVYDRDNKWVKINHIFKNDRKNSPLMMTIHYVENGVNYKICCTEDHPLWVGDRFLRADNIKVGDNIYRSDYLPLRVTQVAYMYDLADSYDIGTATGSFIGSDIIMHNCRTVNGSDINFEPLYRRNIRSVIDTGKPICRTLKSSIQKDGRGNICPTTIILPTIAMEADRDVNKFLKLLNKKLEEAKDSLIDRFNWICSQPWESAKFMYENHVMAGYIPEEGIRSALQHGTVVIGLIGMAETLELLVGCNQTKPEGMELAKRICQLYKDRCAEYKKKYSLNFGVYYTPAENLCYTSMKKFQAQYGVIPKVSDHEFFTNSIHVPVWEKVDALEKIKIESELTGYSSAGCITYVELDASVRNNTQALEKIVDYALEKDIPYLALNLPNDVCMDCGFQQEMPGPCPRCGSTNIQRLRRVTGYLSTDYSNFNKGKIAEVEARVKHTGVNVERDS